MKILPSWAWPLLWKHLRAQHARPAIRFMNIFAFLGLFIGVMAWTSVLSIMNGLQGDIRDRHLKERAHILWEGRPQDLPPNFESQLRGELGSEFKKLNLILQTEGLLEIPSALAGRVRGSGVILQGVDAQEDEVLLGEELANVLSLRPGDEIRLRSVWSLETPPLDFSFDRSFRSEIYDLDKSVVKIQKAKLEEWLGLQGKISLIEIQVKDPLKAQSYVQRLSDKFQIPFKSWEQSQASLWYSLKLEKTMMILSIFFIIVLACLAVHLSLSARVTEKTREIALLMALGSSANILARLYLLEGLFIGVVGSFCGVLGSWLLCFLIRNYGELPDFYYSTSIPIQWSWSENFFMALIAIFLALVASWWPAKRVAQVNIQEALRS